MDRAKLQAWWAKKQGLDGSMANLDAAGVLARAGWMRTVGGAGPYIGLFARAGLSREVVDAAVADAAICELPSARGCTHLLPAADFALGLIAGQSFEEGGDFATARKFLGVTSEEVDAIGDAVLQALEGRDLDPNGLKEVLGDRVRNLGPDGKKRGITTTLPLALGRLQAAGRTRRIPANGRLDQQRFRYARWDPSPLEGDGSSLSEVHRELARRYFEWIGPASLAHFRWFSGLGATVAKKALAALELEPIEDGSDLLILKAESAEFAKFKPPKSPKYALVSNLDNLLLHRRDLKAHIDEADLDLLVSLGAVSPTGGATLSDLPSHAIVDRGRVIGLWEFDQPAGEIAWATFDQSSDAALRKVVGATERFVHDELGDMRSMSLDSPTSREPRVKMLRALQQKR